MTCDAAIGHVTLRRLLLNRAKAQYCTSDTRGHLTLHNITSHDITCHVKVTKIMRQETAVC